MFQWPIYEDASTLNITISTTKSDIKRILSKTSITYKYEGKHLTA